MNAKPKTELNRCVFVQKRNSVNGALDYKYDISNCCTIFISSSSLKPKCKTGQMLLSQKFRFIGNRHVVFSCLSSEIISS